MPPNIPINIQNFGNWKTLIRRIKPYLKKIPSQLVLFLVKLLNCLLLLVCEKIPVPDVFIYSYSFFLSFVFIPNITAICKNKIPPSSELEMISKELENSHLISFSVNLSSESYLQISSKIVIYCLVETHNHVYNILSLLMFDQVFLSFQFSYVVRYFT